MSMPQQSHESVRDLDSRELDIKSSRRNKIRLVSVILAVAAIILTAVLNPNQEQHLKAIQAIAEARKLSNSQVPVDIITRISKYHDYFVFSTLRFESTIMDRHPTVSYGFLGVVKTTGAIQDVLFAIDKWEKSKN